MNETESIVGILGVAIGMTLGGMFINFQVADLVAFSSIMGVVFIGLCLVIKDLNDKE